MRKSWEISIHAKGSRFRFRFKTKLAETRSKFPRFPILSRLYTCLLKPKEAFKLKPKLLERLRLSPSRSKQDAISPKKTRIPKKPEPKISLNRQGKTDKDTNNLGVLIVRSAESLSQSIVQRNGRGVFIHGSSVMLFAFLLWMERLSSKARSLVVFVAVAVVALGVALRVTENVESDKAAVWEAWRYAVHDLSQVRH
ncbi:hypothetical protein LINGRAHAP2_LOCUS4677 [Linum grandiflorum]